MKDWLVKNKHDVIILSSIFLLIFIIITLFVLQWKALKSGRIECENNGGQWYSTSTGKITITRCDGLTKIEN